MSKKEYTFEEMAAAERTLADYMFEHCYRHNKLRPDKITEMTQNQDGTYTITHGGYVKETMICEMFTINDVPVFADKGNGIVYSELMPDQRHLERLTNLCEQAIALRAFQSGKEIIEYFDGIDSHLSKDELTKSIQDAAQSKMGPVLTAHIYGQEIKNPEDVEFMWGYFGKRAIIETPTNIFVHYDSNILEKYNELTRGKGHSVYDRTRLDAIYDSCARTMFGKERTIEEQQKAFSKKLTRMMETDQKGLKRMLAEACYVKGLQPILVNGFDPKESSFEQESHRDSIYFADPKIQSMTTKQDLTVGYRGLDFSESTCVAFDGDTLIAAVCTRGPYTYTTEKVPKIFSSIDFSEELREIQKANIANVLHSWDVQFNHLQRNAPAAEQSMQIASNISDKEAGDITVDIEIPGNR